MKWSIETLNKIVDKELDTLDASFKAKFLHIAEMLEEFGPNNVKQPHCKSLGDKLWEIRMKAKPGIARAIYVTAEEKRIIVLHVFVKKTQKTPKKSIVIAKERLKEIKL
ncbi:MAG: type II toxin-antitoxin system RelE/ParE family toxin [Proteobacteria bacterium]|nr:type II toxin-antitoxin system RelE/ParE family toxin [Pseudomonadota bacterium]